MTTTSTTIPATTQHTTTDAADASTATTATAGAFSGGWSGSDTPGIHKSGEDGVGAISDHQEQREQEDKKAEGQGREQPEEELGATGGALEAMERPEKPLIRYIDCEDDSDFYTGLLPSTEVAPSYTGPDNHKSHHNHHHRGSTGSNSTPGGGMQNHIGNHSTCSATMGGASGSGGGAGVNTYVTTNPSGRQPPTLRVSTPSQTYPPGQLELDRGHILSSSRGVGTPPSPQTPSPPRAAAKKTRFLHPAGAELKSPTAGSLEPNREGGWGWAVLLTATLSHAINGGLALASPVLVSHITATFNGTSTLQAAVAVSTSWGSGALLSPLIAAVSLKYGPRSVCVLGGFVAALGALFNSFSEQLIHVFISFSLIFSLGVAMCNQASRVALRAYFRKTHRGKSRVYHSAPYVGAVAYAYFLHVAMERSGWLRGLQITTVTVAANFLLGLFFTKSRGGRNGGGGSGSGRKGCDTSPFSFNTFKDCFGLEVLREPCVTKWLAIEATTCLVIRSPLLLMVTDTFEEESKFGTLTGPMAIMVWGGCAVCGAFVWRISKRWLPVSPLLFLREQLLLICVIVMGMGITSSVDAYIVTCAAMGLVYGGLDSTLNLQTARLVPSSQRNCAEGWAACFRGVALIVGSPIAVYVNGAAGRRWPGYLLCGAVYTIAVVVLLVFMGDIRERELDMQPPPPNPRPPILLEVTPAAPVPGPGSEAHEYEIDPSKLHVDDDGLGLGDCHQDAGLGAGGGSGTGMVLGYLGDDQVRAVDTGDYRWAKIFTGVDAYTGRLLLCKSYEGGQGEEYAEVVGHQRKRGYSEPALPVLQEYPSQENSSLSRGDNSILSLGLKDLDAISATRADGCSVINASYDGGGEEPDEMIPDSEVRTVHTLPRKTSDSSLFKERLSKGTMTPAATPAGAAAASASGGVRRLSVEAHRAAADAGSALLYGFASHASGTSEEELKLLENEAPKSCYGTSGAFQKQCSLEGAVGGGVPPETLVETTV